jgi:hypothetical protein
VLLASTEIQQLLLATTEIQQLLLATTEIQQLLLAITEIQQFFLASSSPNVTYFNRNTAIGNCFKSERVKDNYSLI